MPRAATPPLPERVLVVRTGAIGDVVNALVVAGALKAAREDAVVGWVVHPLSEPLVRDHPWVDRVHVWRRGGGARELGRLVRELRREHYDLALDLQRLQKSALLARASGAPRVVGHARARTKELSYIWTTERAPGGPTHAHMVDQYLAFADHLGLPRPDPLHRLPEDAEADAWAEARIAELGSAPVVVHLGATWESKLWPAERFGEIAAALAREDDVPVCLAGGPGDRPLAGRALAAAGDAPVVDLVGATTLRQLAALVGRARLWVGCDTGPMHLAAAQGVPLVALFGPGDARRTGPFGQLDQVVTNPVPCAPCGERTCPLGHHACLADLTVERVLAAARERLADAEPDPAA